MKKLLLLAIVVLGISAISFGQGVTSGAATSSATIITPIAISKTADLNFGNIAVNGNLGTVTLPAAAGTPTRTRTGGVTLPATVGTVSAAEFTITGAAGYSYTISVPSTIQLDKGADNITFVPSLSVASPATLTSGNNLIYVGGLLTIPGGQAAGVYTNNTSLKVTVDYN